MTTRRMSLALCLLVIGSASTASAEDEPIELRGYTSAAEVTVDKFVRAVGKLKTYSDEAVIKYKTGMMSQADQETSFAFASPRRFHINTTQYEIVCDGKELTALVKGMRRYTVKPLEEDVHKQVKRYFGGMGMSFNVGDLLLHKHPRKRFAETFTDMDLTGREDIEGDRCVVLSGKMTSKGMPFAEGDVPVSLYLRESDMMVRRVEVDLLETIKKRFEDQESMGFSFNEYLITYDVRDLKVNEPPDEESFKFKPPAGAKKVEKFYGMWRESKDTAAQFELSGKPAPEFEAELAEGGWVTMSDYHGQIVVLFFMTDRRFGANPNLEELNTLREDYVGKNVSIVCVHSGSDATDLTESFDEAGVWFPILLDPDQTLRQEFQIERFASGAVLIGADGIVQGRYGGMLSPMTTDAMRSDFEKLLEGEKLEAAEVMTDEQINEALEQKGARFSFGQSAEPLNDERMRETWSVRADSQKSFGMPFGRGSHNRELWIRDRETIKLVNPSGEVVSEIPLPKMSYDQFSQDQFVAGRLGSRYGVVYMKTIPGEEQQMGYRPPKEVELIGFDDSGRELWKLSFEVTNFQLPQQLTLADIDGRGGDELLFVHQSAIWVVDERGEVIVRKPIVGFAQWMDVDDKDRDRRNEIYLRTPSKLIRIDFR